MVAAAGAAGRLEDEDRDILRAPLLSDSLRTRGDISGFAEAVGTGEELSGTSSGTEKW